MINKKSLTAMGLVAFTATSLFAQNKSTDQQQMGMERPPQQQITPNAAPRVSNGADLFVTAEFLWWKAHQDGLEYVATGVASSFLASTGFPITSEGKIREPNFKFKPGFKVGAGLDLGHDGWDLYLNYTWFQSKKNSSSFIEVSRLSQSTWDELANNFMADVGESLNPFSFTANWKLQSLNVLDLELGRNFYISRYLALRPHFGLKGTWQRQRYDLSVSGIASSGFEDPGFLIAFNTNMKQKFGGVGIRGGMDTTWYICKNFSIFGDMSATALWSRIQSRRFSAVAVPDLVASSTNPITNKFIKYTQDTLTPVLEFALGVRGETWFYDDNYHFAADLGWEEQIWFSMNNFYNVYEHDSHGKLVLHGVTLKVRFDF